MDKRGRLVFAMILRLRQGILLTEGHLLEPSPNGLFWRQYIHLRGIRRQPNLQVGVADV